MKAIQLIKIVSLRAFFVLILALGVSYSAESQTPLWPTADAEWYYTNGDDAYFHGYSHYKIERDTVVLGKNSQIYSRESKTLFTGLPFDTIYESFWDKFYIISLEDSLLQVYNHDINEFDTIINFKAEIGDTWRTYYWYSNCRPDQGTDCFQTRVLNKGTENINGVELLKFTLQRISSEEDTLTDVFYQLLGSKYGSFVYNSLCYQIDYYVESHLRCFSYNEGQGDAFNYTIMEHCDSIPTLNIIKEDEINNMIVINPVVNNTIQIKNIDPSKLAGIKLFDNLGKEIKVTIQAGKEGCLVLPNKQLSSGIYFCSIEFNNNEKRTKKLIVSKSHSFH